MVADRNLNHTAPQHGPKPLPLFLHLLREHAAANPAAGDRALRGLRRYQAAPRQPRAEGTPVAARHGRAMLHDFGGDGPPLVVVPSLINPPFVLDLRPEASLMRWLATQGVRPLLMNWGDPIPDERAVTIAGHVERYLLPLLDQLEEPPLLAGYCLGGTMALAAAALRPVRALALLATPWHFAGFGEASRRAVGALWAQASPACDTLGLVPMEVLQAGFWQLDPASTVAKFAALADLPEGSAAEASFVALEDWANAGAPLTYAAGRELFGFFADDDPGLGGWTVADRPIRPETITCPVANFVSLTDRIVPAGSACELGVRHDVAAGHVGMIVGSKARARLWEPLARFLHTA